LRLILAPKGIPESVFEANFTPAAFLLLDDEVELETLVLFTLLRNKRVIIYMFVGV